MTETDRACTHGFTHCPACLPLPIGWNATEQLDLLAEYAGCNLWLEDDADAPMRFAVWEHDTGIIGAGNTADEAIEYARCTIRAWEVEASK